LGFDYRQIRAKQVGRLSDKQERLNGKSDKAETEFFTVGPPLHAVRAGYIRRAADDFLYDSIIAGHHAYVLAPARSGKTSLIAATSARLQNNGYKVATLDLAQIGERDGGADSGRWYYSVAYRLLRQLRMKFDLHLWWQDKSILSNRQRLVEFYGEVILANVKEQVVVFIDELQCVEGLQFAQDLLASIHSVHRSLATETEFSRLIFVLCGECDPQVLVSDEGFSPFDNMKAVHLDDFSRKDTDVFLTEMNLSNADAILALDRIYYWSSGQPYLSQKLARAVARERIAGDIAGHVDRIALHQLGGRSALHNEPHMGHIHRRIVSDSSDKEALLTLYGRMRKGIVIPVDPDSRQQRKLMAIGLVVSDQADNLRPRNRLYDSVFTARWANENLAIRWQGPAIAVAILAVLIAIPFWYTQLLPKPYLRILTSPSLELATIAEAYVNFRSFPGHAGSADRLFSNLLEERARAAKNKAEIAQISDYATSVPGRERFAETLTASYWDNVVQSAFREEHRDDALLASLETLVLSTPQRRRIAASLIGDDYPQLIDTVTSDGSDQLMFNPSSQLLTMVDGARISQWSMINEQLQSRTPWTVTALEITPLVRRVVVDSDGSVSRISLMVNVGHGRLDDLSMRLIAPSGRAAEFEFGEISSSERDEIRFSGALLAGLVGEPLSGTWTLSIRDESTGTAGHLIGWNLRLNSQVIVENFERGLDIPEPMERESNNIWFSKDGRYAIARAQQSDSARLWDLAYAQPARTLAVPASEKVLGLSANAEYLVTVAQDTVHLWHAASGRRAKEMHVGLTMDARLTDDGRNLLVSRSIEGETAFELWNIESAERIAGLTVAGSPALISLDRAGHHLAIADYDRSIRIWHFPTGELLGQLDLHAQASDMELAPNGDTLGVVHGDQGITLWRVDRPGGPIVKETEIGEWQLGFSPSGSLFIAGSGEQGFQVYRTPDGSVSGPQLGSGLSSGANIHLSFSNDERTIVTAEESGRARFWRAPTLPAVFETSSESDGEPAHRPWQESNDSVSALSPGGRRLAIGDNDGHVHVMSVGTRQQPPTNAGDDLNFLGHLSAVTKLKFSVDGSLIASASLDGTIRIWDAVSGLPRPYHASASSSTVEQLMFSQSGRRLAVLSGQSVWVMSVETGRVLTEIELGEPHADLAFADEDRLYLGGESGALRSLAADRLGNWNLRNVWQGSSALRRIQLAANRPLLVLTDATNTAYVFDISDGSMASRGLQLPGPITDVLFAPGDSRVLLRTSRWIHRADVSRSGLAWHSAVRAPRTLRKSRMVFDDRVPAPTAAGTARVGNQVLMLTRDAGFIELVDLHLAYADGAMLYGSRGELLDQWRSKLGREEAQ
jgi:WD40 repeat protein